MKPGCVSLIFAAGTRSARVRHARAHGPVPGPAFAARPALSAFHPTSSTPCARENTSAGTLKTPLAPVPNPEPTLHPVGLLEALGMERDCA